MCKIAYKSRPNIPNLTNPDHISSPAPEKGGDVFLGTLMYKYILFILFLFVLGALLYALGQKDCQNQHLTTHQEQQDHVIRKKSEIYARPNPDRDTLLKLMRNGTL